MATRSPYSLMFAAAGRWPAPQPLLPVRRFGRQFAVPCCQALRIRSPVVDDLPTMRPVVAAAETPFNRAVLEECEQLRKDYTTPMLLFNNHVETIWAAWFRTNLKLDLDREYLRTTDGGVVALDTLEDASIPPDAPVLIMLAGLAGGSSCTYVQFAIQSAQQMGFRAVVFNGRGMASSAVKTAQFYSASYTEDTRLVVKHLHEKFPNSPLCAVGWSLGANILVNYLGEEGEKSTLLAAASLGNPFNLPLCDQNFQRGFARVYDRNLASSMKSCFGPHLHLFKGYDVESAFSANSVRDIDEAITRVTFGWQSVDDYYRGSSSADRIENVRVPLLCIQAADDPICLAEAIPEQAIRQNDHCCLVVTPKGGHLGWITPEAGFFGAPWTDSVVLEWLSAVLTQTQYCKRQQEKLRDFNIDTAQS